MCIGPTNKRDLDAEATPRCRGERHTPRNEADHDNNL